jgi:hypothetical protein
LLPHLKRSHSKIPQRPPDARSPMNLKSRCLALLPVAAWLTLVAAGFALWERYDSTPGARAAEPSAAPFDRGAGWELVVFLHPHCPCSEAALGELAEIVAAAPQRLTIRVLFVRPAGVAEAWERTDLWAKASGVRGVSVECDRGGTIAARTGATTSGYAVMYDPAGRVAFRGGLTRGRGRAGESAGRRAVLGVLSGEEPESRAVPAFGCSLF